MGHSARHSFGRGEIALDESFLLDSDASFGSSFRCSMKIHKKVSFFFKRASFTHRNENRTITLPK